jgi:hypothetical protein
MGMLKLLFYVLVFLRVALVDGEVDLEVVIPKITRGADVVKDVTGTSSIIIQEEVAFEKACEGCGKENLMMALVVTCIPTWQGGRPIR